MDLDGLDDLIADSERGIETRHRLLEDHRDLVAAQSAFFLSPSVNRSRSPKRISLARNAARTSRQEAHDRQGRYRLSRAALADEGEGLAVTHLEADIFDDVQVSLGGGEVDAEPGHPQKRKARAGFGSSDAAHSRAWSSVDS